MFSPEVVECNVKVVVTNTNSSINSRYALILGTGPGIAALMGRIIDFIKIKSGKPSVKGKAFNITGIILGPIGIALIICINHLLSFSLI